MIRKLENNTTLITLGEGTVYTGLAKSEGVPVGISFTNKKVFGEKPEDAVVIQITSEKAVASYLMALFRLMETWDDDENSAYSQTIKHMKKDLEMLMPKDANEVTSDEQQ